jgi:hypothetical protein
MRKLTYHGSFHLSPFVFGDEPGIQNNQVKVYCMILSDKFNPTGNATSDRNCVEDVLLESQKLWPNSGNGYLPAQAQEMMIPDSGTIFDDNLKINRGRFKVHHYKSWMIVPSTWPRVGAPRLPP